MKIIKNRKTLSAIAAVLFFTVLGTTFFLQVDTVLAQRRFSGLDTLIQQKTDDTETFRILEIVKDKDDAEIGFYIRGNEPFSVDENGEAVDFETTLSKIADQEKRKTYVNNLLEKRLKGKYGAQGDENFPISYSEYKDSYFVDDESGWKWVKFPQNEYVKLKGEYIPTVGGTQDGDYTQNSTYILAYDYATNTYNGNYRENLAGFDASSLEPAYIVDFGTTPGDYGYLGVYTQQFDAIGEVTTAEEFSELQSQNDGKYWIKQNDTYQEIDLTNYVYEQLSTDDADKEIFAKDIVLYKASYKYAGASSVGLTGELYYVQGYEYAYNGLEYMGTYGGIFRNGEPQYVECEDGELGTHKLSEYEYSYTPGIGNYNFVESESGAEVFVELEGFYCQGGFENNNWFRKNVLLSREEEIERDLLPISVRTLTVDELCEENTKIFDEIDLLVINGDEDLFSNSDRTALETIAQVLGRKISGNTESEDKLPCLIDSAIVKKSDSKTESKLVKVLREQYKQGEAGHNGLVQGSVYWYEGDLFNINFRKTFETSADKIGFEEVVKYIEVENEYLELRKEELLSEDLSQAIAVQYVLSTKYARNIAPKQELTVLEIQPCADYELNHEVVNRITGYDLEKDDIHIVQMTTAEFVGKIHDLNGVYDFIYFGMKTGLMNTDIDGNTLYNDASMNGLVYTHTGDAVISAERLTGLLDTDYVESDRANLPYSRDVYKIRTTLKDGKLVLNQETIKNFAINTPGTTEVKKDLVVGNQGVYRYSGNDITKENVELLMDYVNAGYPIILAKDFATENVVGGTGEVEINTAKVDSSSYLYEFLKSAFDKKNVFLYTEQLSTYSDFTFCMNLPKLQLTFYKEADREEDGELYVKDDSVTEHMSDKTGQFVKTEDGSNYLKYVISIKDEASVSTLDTKYTVSIFVDINSDGKYSREYEMMQNVQVTEEDGTAIAYDELVAGKKYIVTRRIPDAFRSVVPWKLEVSLSKSDSAEEMFGFNDQSLIRKSQMGYSKVFSDEKTKISIYQILSDPKNGKDSNTWNMAQDSELQALIKQQGEYDITFKTNYVSEYQALSDQNTTESYYDKIKQYDMLVIGFSDVYEGFTNAYAVEAILQFIESGKSVLFTHDTTSFVNYPGGTADNIAGDSGYIFIDNSAESIGGSRWGYLLNQIVRDKLGMDRYGITNSDSYMQTLKAEGTTENVENTAFSEEKAKEELSILLKMGQILELNKKVKEYNASLTYDGTVSELMTLAHKEPAYVANTGKTQTYPETHGYTYSALNNCESILDDTFKESKGERTKYLNLNDQSGVRNLGKTWADTFKEFFGITTDSGNSWWDDLLNSLFDIFGKFFDKLFGSIHNGSFDYMEITCVNRGQITEYPFAVDEKFEIASTHAQYYQLDMEADQDNDGESDIVVWYCISNGYNKTGSKDTPNPYSASPNDVRNNYYIYSIGNVFYTGAGHSKITNDNERKLFINTLVAAYNAAVNEPSVTILEEEDIYAAEKSSENLPVEYSLGSDSETSAYLGNNSISISYSVYDDNFVYASDVEKKLNVEYFIEDSSGETQINGVSVRKLEAGEFVTRRNGGTVAEDAIESGKAYTVTLSMSGKELYDNYLTNKESVSIYVRVGATVPHNGEDVTLYGYDKLALKKTNLFELD